MMRAFVFLSIVSLTSLAATTELESARDRQDRAALQKAAGEFSSATEKSPKDAAAHYRLALAQSYLAEIAMETGDKNQAKSAAETGIKAAQAAVAIAPNVSEHQRILGTLCGQIIPANILLGMKYGKCAQESIAKAIELDPKSSMAYLSQGIGHYYTPSAFGGGIDLAIKDFQKSLELNPKSADAHLWLGVALRKAHRNAEAHQALEKSIQLNPNRVWAKQQLQKIPAQ
jgi:tetratricopeptide (TPR) repeat protein